MGHDKRWTLKGICQLKTQRFRDEIFKMHKKTNLTWEWMYARLKKLLLPGNFIACETCGMATTFEGITIDHKIPRSLHKSYRGNVHNIDNLEFICNSCNSLKGQRTLPEFLEWLAKRNQELLKFSQHSNEIVAPLFPNVGLGQKIFGQDKSHKKLIRQKSKNKPS